MPNPAVKLAMTGAAAGASLLAKKALHTGWGAAFGEDAPTAKTQKQAKKDTKALRKQAKKNGASKEDIAAIRNPADQVPVWKTLLWTALSGIAIQGVRHLARRGTQRVLSRRPRANRG
ncbi:DUF4235 domain-containing protein [Devriesea agamarum]|uniref:DUF4235 domain-containing protein n=1 Tax=Devriesea agamarum TaxID=472569 RepID=UPI00071E5942|nr:DUF4235 domain-containing protein [Devriesea agamarum]